MPPYRTYPRLSWAFFPLMACVLVACGGGGSGGVGSTTGQQSVSGRVIDGYIGGARVCVDENNNWKCDSGEASTVTLPDGSYSIPYTGSLDGKQILAEVPEGATDTDFPGAPIEKPFSLVSPAESARSGAEIPVTPFTTMVSKEMVISGASKEAAAAAVKVEFGLRENPLTFDYKARNDGKALEAAQVLTAAIAIATDELIKNAGGELTAGEMAIAAAKQVKQNIAPLLINSDGSIAVAKCSANCKQSDLIATINQSQAADAIQSISGQIRTIVAETKSGSGKVTDFRQAVNNGLVILDLDTSDFLYGSGEELIRVNGFYNGYQKEVRAEVLSLVNNRLSNPTEKVWLSKEKRLRASDFAGPPRVPNARDITIPKGWYPTWRSVETVKSWSTGATSWRERIEADGLTSDVVIDSNCVILSDTGAGNIKACLVEKDLAGKTLDEVFPDVCKDAGVVISGCNPNARLPDGSYGFSLGLEFTKDSYEIWASPEWNGYNWEGRDNPSSSGGGTAPSMARFLDWHARLWSFTASCRIAFKVIKETPTTGKFHWAYDESSSCKSPNNNWDFSEKTNYVLETIAGVEVIKVDVPNLYRRAKPGDMLGGCKFAFAIANRPVLKAGRSVYSTSVDDYEMPATPLPGIYKGEYCAANVRGTYEFTGNLDASGQFMSAVLARFLGEQRGVDMTGLLGPRR